MPIIKEGDEEFVVSAIKEINKKHNNTPQHEYPIPGQNKPVNSEIVCPKCKGRLWYSISGYNGHVWGKCNTKDCLVWMM